MIYLIDDNDSVRNGFQVKLGDNGLKYILFWQKIQDSPYTLLKTPLYIMKKWIGANKPKKPTVKRRYGMKRPKLIQLCFLFLLCIGFAGWATHASGQQTQGSDAVVKEMEKAMPLLKGTVWQKVDHNAKLGFVWGVAHVILIEKVLMEEIPELRRENFVAKVLEARAARISAGKAAMSMNEVVYQIDQYYKDHPDQLEVPVMKVIWDVAVKPYIKTGIAGRPLK